MKNDNLNISLVQAYLQWEDIDANLQKFDSIFNSIHNHTDLIVLPEMFNTGFTMNAPKVAEKMGGKTHQWLQEKAESLQAAITGSVVIEENGKYFNRLLWVFPDGTTQTYDKRHLFRMGKEHETYSAGENKLIVDYKGWKVCPMICYDLRFPVWSRNVGNEYDLLIYVANWPRIRNFVWWSLLRARAMENLAYVAGVNRIGEDINQIPHSGDSSLIDFTGKTIRTSKDEEIIFSHNLSKDALQKFRNRFPAWMDADEFEISV